IYGGWSYMISRGDKIKVDKAVKILTNAVIGLLIILSSFIITTFIINALTKRGQSQSIVQERAKRYFEPLSGALGAGVINDHYPPRGAVEMPRNVNIFVTFKVPIDPATIIDGYKEELGENEEQSVNLKTSNIKIYKTADGAGDALASDQVRTYVSEDKQTFVFVPRSFLGSSVTDTNYTVSLGPGIRKTDGASAFVSGGRYESENGYEWIFEVSTDLDLEPPKVVSVIPKAGETEERNTIVAITFSEAMNPIMASGSYIPSEGKLFNIIRVNDNTVADSPAIVEGSFVISNGYKTVDFVSTDKCGVDPCGNDIYCLPADASLGVNAKAAKLDSPLEIPPNPQADLSAGMYNGLVDASGNSFNGNGNTTTRESLLIAGYSNTSAVGETESDIDKIIQKVGTDTGFAEGEVVDGYDWSFATNNNINTTPPNITGLSPTLFGEDVLEEQDVEITFSGLLFPRTVNSDNIQIWPVPLYPFWFVNSLDGEIVSKITIKHAAMISKEDGGHGYMPTITQGVRSKNQICMVPAKGPGKIGKTLGECGVNDTSPNCCAEILGVDEATGGITTTKNQKAQVGPCSPPL
ncbi:MAG: Ig-like domain-containing protein, partial [Patescibacteria group bacterium]